MKTALGSLVLVFAFFQIQAQNPINPYENYDQQPPPDYLITQGTTNFYYSSYEGTLIPGFDGEYMIDIHFLFWYFQTGQSGFADKAKSYSMEVVSFPFTMDCAFTPATPCTTLFGRDLNLPSDPYDAANNTWGVNLWRIRDQIPFFPGSGITGGVINPESLVTNGFHTTCYEPPPVPPANYYRSYLPHSVIKQTLYLHCGTNTTTQIIDSISWYYDNTRGRMRDYPFCPQNGPPCTEQQYDVVFRPFYLVKPFEHYYDETENTLLFTDGTNYGTIDYYPWDYSNPATCLNPGAPTDAFFLEPPYYPDPTYFYSTPASYTLLSALLYKARQGYMAGYDYGGSGFMTIDQGIKQNYTIDKNIDLTIINPNEKIIYNPSEANVTASNLLFPEGYTFKTIRGRYPARIEVETANLDPDFGGPYADLRDVPVLTDVRSENPADPHDPFIPEDAVYASRYYLQNGSKVTVENCVKFFDLAFDVHEGATLLFQDHSQILGNEDKDNNTGRYKIKGLGGAVLRNYDNVQYVQNGNITQTYPLNYIAKSIIHAGDAVDIDADQPDGNYEVHAGADVTFKAGNYVHLANGFYVSGGNFHAYTDPNMPQLDICYDSQLPGGGGRVAQQVKGGYSSSPYKISPNPGTGLFNLYNPAGKFNESKLTISDIMGNKVFEKENLSASKIEFDLTAQPKGVYIVKLDEGNKITVNKIVIQ